MVRIRKRIFAERATLSVSPHVSRYIPNKFPSSRERVTSVSAFRLCLSASGEGRVGGKGQGSFSVFH